MARCRDRVPYLQGVRARAAQYRVSSHTAGDDLMAEELGNTDIQRLLRAAEREADSEDGAPLVIAGLNPPRVLWASAAACMLLATPSRAKLTRVLFGVATNRVLVERLRRLRPGAPDQLERLSLVSGFHVERLTLLNRAVDDAQSGKVVVIQIAGGSATRQAEPALSLASPTDDRPTVRDDPGAAQNHSEVDLIPESAASAVVLRSVEEVASGFGAQWPAGRQARFVWELDADGRLVAIDKSFASFVGGTAPQPGVYFEELIGAYSPQASQLVRAARDERRSFSGLSVLWPVSDSHALVATTFGGAPLRGDAPGFRGFGILHLDQVSAAPVAHSPAVEPADVLAITPPAATTDPDDQSSPRAEDASLYLEVPETDADENGSGSAEDAALTLSPHRPVMPPGHSVPPPHQDSKVVHLMRFKGANQNLPAPPTAQRPSARHSTAEVDAAPLLPPEPQWSESPESTSGPATQLSRTEQSAFKEIARTLGGIDAVENEGTASEELAAADAAVVPDGSAARSDPRQDEPQTGMTEVLEQIPAGVMVVQGGQIVFANRRLLDLLGYVDIEGYAGSASAATLFIGTPDQLAATGEAPRAINLRDHNGSDIAFEARAQAISWRHAPATLAIVERLREEESEARIAAIRLDLARAKNLAQDFHDALDSAASGAGFLDATGRILSINPAAERFFGYDQREVVGDACALFVVSDERDVWSAFLARFTSSANEPGHAERRSFTCRKRSGESVNLDIGLKMLGEGRVSVVWQARQAGGDLDLDAARRNAERASALKSEFLAKVSHEIRTPLNAIIGFADVMMEERFGPVGNERYKEYLRDIHASGSHVMSLVTDLLDLSRIEAGRSDLKLVAVDANAIVSACVGTLQNQAHRERVILRLSLAPRLPPVLADERALRQIVLNLLSNAVKFNEPGGQVIVSTALTERERIAIRVRDTGLGMSDKDIETAMEPFRQLETPKASAGSGLGLPLTKALVEASRANMAIKSRPREGTLVEVIFQKSPAEAMSVPAE